MIQPSPCPPALQQSPGSPNEYLDMVNSVAWQPRPVGREVLACATNKGGKLWDMEGGGTGIEEFGDNVEINEVAWSRDGLRLATLGNRVWSPDGVKVWKFDGSRPVTPVMGLVTQFNHQVKKDELVSIKFNRSGSLLAVTEYRYPPRVFEDPERVVHVFNANTGVSSKTVELEIGGPFAWGNEEEFFCGGDQTITIHKVGEEDPVQVLTSRSFVFDLAFNEKSGILAACGYSGVEMWIPPQHQPSFIHTDSLVRQVRWNPVYSNILAGSLSHGGVQIWDTETSESLVMIPSDFNYSYNDISFSPDGRFLAGCGDSVKVWKVEGGQMVAECETGVAYRASWSPKGDKLAVRARDKSVKVFEIVTMN